MICLKVTAGIQIICIMQFRVLFLYTKTSFLGCKNSIIYILKNTNKISIPCFVADFETDVSMLNFLSFTFCNKNLKNMHWLTDDLNANFIPKFKIMIKFLYDA